MLRPPPRSPLFPYTTLFRSAGVFSLFWDAEAAGVPADVNVVGADRDSGGTLVVSFDVPTNLGGTWYLPGRSEEHTSELQSRLHLVCRLLLEKKKKNKAPSKP